MSRDDTRTYIIYGAILLAFICMAVYTYTPPSLKTLSEKESYAEKYLPDGAQNIKKLGRYWVQFELDGEEYLYFRMKETYGASVAITKK